MKSGIVTQEPIGPSDRRSAILVPISHRASDSGIEKATVNPDFDSLSTVLSRRPVHLMGAYSKLSAHEWTLTNLLAKVRGAAPRQGSSEPCARRRTHLNAREKTELVRRYEAGEVAIEMARAFVISQSAAKDIVQRVGA